MGAKIVAKPVQLKAPCIRCLDLLGFGCRRIGRMVHVSPSSVRRILSPEYAERVRACVRSWAARNYSRGLATTEAWRLRNLEHRRQKIKGWRVINPHKANEYESKALQQPQRRIAAAVRRRARSVLFSRKAAISATALIGCSWDHLRKWIEAQFQAGMTWQNYGVRGWHLDHKRPLASFDLTNANDLNEAFHFSNLQPLWAADNIRKHAFYDKKAVA